MIMVYLNSTLSSYSSFKNVLMRLFSLLFFNLFVLVLIAQPTNKTTGELHPISPEAYAQGKYAEIPVNKANGVGSVSIPIAKISEGNLSVDISMNYHLGGIRLDEMASWVGLGWALNAGGMISRTVLGTPDDWKNPFNNDYGGYYYNAQDLLDPTHDKSAETAQQVREALLGTVDTEPDLFYFNFNGYSGKFVFDNDQQPHQILKSDLKIEITQFKSFRFTEFKITTPDGTKYYFGTNDPNENNNIEVNENLGAALSSQYYNSSWYLHKIESADSNHEINFEYQYEGRVSFLTRPVDHIKLNRDNSICGYDYNGCSPISINEFGEVYNEIKKWRLNSIKSTYQEIEFVANEERVDFVGTKRLDQVIVKNGSQESLQKVFDFNYSYMTSAPIPNLSNRDNRTERLILNRIQEKAKNGSIMRNPYIFEYYPGILPERLSWEIDHWGYYNDSGDSNNESNYYGIPPYPVVNDHYTYDFATGNRNTNQDAMKIANLKTVTYPLGGTREFVLEANKVFDIVGLEWVWEIEEPFPITTCFHPGLPDCCGAYQYQEVNYNHQGEIGETDLYFCRLIGQDTYYFNSDSNDNNNCGNNNIEDIVTVEVRDDLGNFINSLDITIPLGYGNIEHEDFPISDLFLPEFGKTYKIKLISLNSSYGEFHIRKKVYNESPPEDINVGGLRIKEIIEKDNFSFSQDKTITYDYKNTDGEESGRMFKSPKYGSKMYNWEEGPHGKIIMIKILNNSIFPLTSYNGNIVNYEYTTEKIEGFGKKVYQNYLEYSLHEDVNHPTYFFPLAPQAPKLLEAALKKISVIDEAGNLIQEKEFSYYATMYEDIPGLSYRVDGDIHVFYPSEISTNEAVKLYYNKFGYKRLKSISSVNDGVSNIETYTYDQNNRFELPKTSSYINSKGQICETEFTYNIDGNDGVYSELNNRLLPACETKKKVNGTTVSGEKLEYSGFDFKRVSKIYGYFNGWKERGHIKEYDGDGNISKFCQYGWSDQEFIWDPGARLKKAKYINQEIDYGYKDDSKLLFYIKDINDFKTYFYYDGLQRLKSKTSRNSGVTQDITYHDYSSAEPHNWINVVDIYDGGEFGMSKSLKNKTILDGFGQEIESIKCGYSPRGKDVYSSSILNALGLPIKISNPVEGQTDCDFYGNIGREHWAIEYEQSLLGREIFRQMSTWAFGTCLVYGSNSIDEVRRYNLNCDNPVVIGSYAPGKLFKVESIDENENSTETFKDIDGRTVLIRKYLDISHQAAITGINESGNPISSGDDPPVGGELVDTYFVYDEIGRLRTIISPKGADGYQGEVNYCYEYDDLNRIVKNIIPGSGVKEFGYHETDLVKWEEDANQNRKTFSYDGYGRLNAIRFSNPTYSAQTSTTLSTAVYPTVNNKANNQFISQPIQTTERVLEKNDEFGPLLRTDYVYDDWARLQESVSDNHLGFKDVLTYTYDDYADNIKSVKNDHHGFENLDVVTSNVYDKSMRLTRNSHQVNWEDSSPDATSSPFVKMASFSYSHKDEVVKKEIGNSTFTYHNKYNDFGWLTNINGSGSGHEFPDAFCLPPEPFVLDLDIDSCVEAETPEDPLPPTSNLGYLLIDCDTVPNSCPIDPIEIQEMNIVIAEFIDFISILNPNDMIFPQALNRVRFCDGTEINLSTSHLEFATFNGIEIPPYVILQSLCISSFDELFDVYWEESNSNQNTFAEAIMAQNEGYDVNFDGYPRCGEDDRCHFVSTRYSTDSNICDYDISSEGNTNNTICSEDFPPINSEAYCEYAAICLNFTPPNIDCDSVLIDSIVISFSFEIDTSCFNVSTDDFNVYVGTNVNTFGTTKATNGSITLMNPDTQVVQVCLYGFGEHFSFGEYCDFCISDVKVTTFYNCDCPTPSPPPPPPTCPCEPNDPEGPCYQGCDPGILDDQMEWLDDLRDWAESIQFTTDIEFPITMCRITLCDGTKVSVPEQYYTENPIPGMPNPLVCEETEKIPEPPDCIEYNPIDFAMKISYADPNSAYSNATPQYNGNISQIEYQIMKKDIEAYNYQYDNLDRLKEANYWWKSCKEQYWQNDFYSVKGIEYDLNGNMERIRRNTKPLDLCETVMIDDLEMTYLGNRLANVIDNASENNNGSGKNSYGDLGYFLPPGQDGDYEYDGNGNMTKLGNHPDHISYNLLNLPGSSNGTIWHYSYNGSKLKENNKDYIQGIEYRDQKLYSIKTSEGRYFLSKEYLEGDTSLPPSKEDWEYQYYVKDHLGNNRLLIDGSKRVIQENNFYPFGMRQENYQAVIDKELNNSDYLYNGKEMNEEFGLLDYGARFYDPSIARFSSVDPLAEMMPSHSSYSYTFNNPLKFTDPTGMAPETIYRNNDGDEVEVNDGIDKTINVDDAAFEEAKFFANELNQVKGSSFSPDGDVITAYENFYSAQNEFSYGDNELSVANIYDYLFIKPKIENDSRPLTGSGGIGLIGGGPGGKIAMKQGITPFSRALKLYSIQSHHIIPKAVYKQFAKQLAPFMKLNGKFNLKNLPTPFHGNHPQYNRYVGDRISALGRAGNINASSLRALQKDLRHQIGDAYNSGQRLNDYFRGL